MSGQYAFFARLFSISAYTQLKHQSLQLEHSGLCLFAVTLYTSDVIFYDLRYTHISYCSYRLN